MIRAGWLGAMLAGLCVFAPGAAAQLAPLDAPQPDRTVRDPEFGVVARHLGLERQVEMLQWQATPGGYAKTWSAQAIDSSGYAPGHQNPGALPLRTRRWVAKSVNIAGKPVDPQVIRAFAEWRDFRPSFAALPGNLAATFQPEGDGLGSAENPLDPQIGDLRIRWRDLVLPLLDGKIALRNGRWQPVAEAAPPVEGRAGSPATAPASAWWRLWPWLIGALVLLLIGAVRRRRR